MIIQALKKITLSLRLGNSGHEPIALTFIYGIGGNGLCPFEQALQGKEQGDSLNFSGTDAQAADYFGHLLFPLRQALGLQIMPKTLSLQVAITTVQDAENREVVQSLAKTASGCGGSCGCGCS